MARSDAAVSILQFDGASVTHLAAVAEDNTLRVEDFAAAALEGAPAAEQLRTFADAREIARDSLYTVLPRHEVTVRIVHLPARDPQEVAAMVDLSAGEFVPYSRDSLVVKHHVLAELPSGESAVLVVLVNRDVIDRHIALLHAAGLEPRQIFLSTACLHAARALAEPAQAERYAVVHLGGRAIEIAVFDRGDLKFSRGVVQDEAWNLDDARSRESLAYEVRDALSAYRRECEDGLGVSTVVPMVETGAASAFSAFLSEATGKDCREDSLAAALVANPDALAGSCPAVGLGAVLAATGRAPMVLNLLPDAIARERSLRGVQQRVLRLAAIIAVVLAALAAWFGQAVIQRLLLIRELRSEAEALAPSAEGVAAKQERLQLISRQLDQGSGFLELLSAVATAAPPSDFNITRIEYDRETGINIWGRARAMDLVLTDFLGNLRSLGEGSLAMLARAHSEYERAGQERNEAVYNYHVTIPAPEELADAPDAPTR